MVNRRFGKSIKPKPKRSSGFVYKPRTVESIKRRAERTGGRYDSPFKPGYDSYRTEIGSNVLRILPPTWEDENHEDYGYTVWMHSFVGLDKGTYICLNKMKNKRCPICIAAKQAEKDGDNEEAKDLLPAEKVVCWVLNRKTKDNRPLLWTLSWSMDREINAQCYDKAHPERALLIDHPDEGYDLSFQRTGQGLNTRYIGMKIDREASPICDDEKEQEEILAFIQQHPIPSILNWPDEAKLETVMEGTGETVDTELDEDEEEEERPKLKAKSKVRARDDDEDETEDENDEDEDEDEEDDDDNGEEEEADEGEEESDEDEDEEEQTAGNGAEEDDDEEEDERPAKRRPPSREERRPQLRAKRGR